jgi:hypothetical protein
MKVINKFANYKYTKRILNILFVILVFVTKSYSQKHVTNISETKSQLEIGNGLVSIVFPKLTTFDIKSIQLNGNFLLKNTGFNTTPWILTYKGVKGENPILFPSDGVYKGYSIQKNQKSFSITFIWDMRLSYEETYPVKMSITITDNSDLIAWNIEANIPHGWVIIKSQFPRITLQRLDRGKIITSAGWGNEYNLLPRTYSESYPSHTGAMQLLLMHNHQGAFYYATEDRNACGKRLSAICGNKMITFITETVASESWSNVKTGEFKLPWQTVIGYDAKGWQDATIKWYKPFTYTTEWGKKTLNSRHIPHWIYDTDLWIRAKGVNDTVMHAINNTIKYYGKGIGIHWYYWHHYPYDTHYPEYFPAKYHFKDMIRKIRSEKGYVIPYINGRLWDPEAESYTKLNGKETSCRKPDGTLYTEIYPTSKVINAVSCPASSLWQKIITDLVDKIQNELNTNGVYIDQIAAAAPQPCWANNHDHPKGGGDFWFKAYRRMIENIRNNHLLKNNILITEENAECCIDLFDLLLMVNTPHENCRIVPLFPMVYSDRVLTVAFTYTPTDKLTEGDFCYENTMCFLYGSQLGWVDPVLLMRKESAGEAAFLKELVNNRKKCHNIFNGGKFVKEITPLGDNPTIDIKGFGTTTMIRATKWISREGKSVTFIVNMDKKEHKVTLPGDSQLIEIKAKKVVIKY